MRPRSARDEAESKAKSDDGEEDAEDSSSQLELVSGSADSTLTFWADTTTQTALAATTQATQRIEQDQELQNAIRANNFRDAIVLSLQLNHPKRLLEVFRSANDNPSTEVESLTGRVEVDDVLASLSESQLWNLLRRLRDWNANGRTHHVAQRVLYALFRIYPKEKIIGLQRRRKQIAAADDDPVKTPLR